MSASQQPSRTPKRRGAGSTGRGGSKRAERTAAGFRKSFVDALAWFITAVWGVSFILDTLVESYDPPPTIHALMMAVATAAIGGNLIKKKEDE